MGKKKFFVFLGVFLGFLLIFNFTFAREIEWPEIPGTDFTKGNKCPTSGCPPENLADFVVYIFNLSLVIAGFVTFVMIIIAGVQYMLLAVESPAAAQAALSRIKNSLLALILLFGAFLILNAINPELLVPGLEKTNISGTPLGEMNVFDRECKDGVLVYNGDNCQGDSRCFYYNVENLSDYQFDDKIKSLKIKGSSIVNFFENPNFSGDVVAAEGPSEECISISTIGPPDLTGKVSSIKFEEKIEGVVVCEEESPSPETCGFFPYNALEIAQKAKFKYGDSVNIQVTMPGVPNAYDLKNGNYEIGDDKASWVYIPQGFIMIGCKDSGDPPSKCYFFLEPSILVFYGDGSGINDPIKNRMSFFYISGLTDPHKNLKPCKGVIFYTDDYYNKGKYYGWWIISAAEEAAAFPIGLGDFSPGSTIDLSSGFKNFTKIKNILKHKEIDWGDNNTNDIASLKLLGNCKIKICDDKDLGGNCTVLTGNYYPDLRTVCRPEQCYKTCTKTGNPGETVNCTVTCPGAPCSGGNKTCTCTIPYGQTSCTCAVCCGNNWYEAIKSFILCNKDDNTPPCDFP